MSRRRQRLRMKRQSQQRRFHGVLIVCGVAVAVVAGAALAGATAFHSVGTHLRENEDTLEEIRLGQNTRVYDRNGALMGTIAADQNRTKVRSRHIPKILKHATVAIEDKRFYNHKGVDYNRLVGAAIKDIQTRSAREGGSTITMQLVKNLHEGGDTRSFGRKVTEAYLAYQYEKKYTKDEILTQYLNDTFYGHNAVGVEAASRTYFNKTVRNINLPQAALLAGLPQAPTDYNPFENPETSRERRNLVLQAMAEQGYISHARANKAKQAGLGLQRGRDFMGARRQPFVFDYVRQELDQRFGAERVRQAGLRAYTTVDPALQQAAKNAIDQYMPGPDAPGVAVVMLDSRTGWIRTMQSNQEYGRGNQFNLATTAQRQPGSVFKVPVLTRFVQDGYDPYSTNYVSRPLKYANLTYGGRTWGPLDVKTYGGTYGGRMTAARALLSSDNSVYTQMTLDVGPGKVAETAYQMGVPRSRQLGEYPSIGLGGLEHGVTVLDMAVMFSTLANGGFRVRPMAVNKVLRANGSQITLRPQRTRVMPDGVTSVVTKVLRENVTSGTGTGANIGMVAGKTGTTERHVDAWFAAYTPCYTTVVWMGYPNTESTRYLPGITGGAQPASIWAAFMREVLANPRYACARESFPEPNNPVSLRSLDSEFTRAPPPPEPEEDETTTGSEPETNTQNAAAPAAAPVTPSPPARQAPAAPQVQAPRPPAAPTPSPSVTPAPAPAPAPAPPPPG